ncbi:hypothetical protein [Leptolyngbya ohadii]|uniref:hypothetical protein n=1 Tax=Leptolyngbya ohadii TaxID=1962290 RepID=UPI00117A906F|nr:hypothetical protein [Leptolyngbya ohadii]
MQFIFLLFGGAIATTSVLGLAVLSWMAEVSSSSLGYIASCAPSQPEESKKEGSSQESSPSPAPSPSPSSQS